MNARPQPTRLRVRYSEVDRMGLLYHCNHLEYFEVARSDWIRQFWRSYCEVEDQGLCLVVIEAKLNYHRPAYYDQELTVEITGIKWGRSRLTFEYAIRRDDLPDPICTGHTTHCFINRSGAVQRIPDELRRRLEETYR